MLVDAIRRGASDIHFEPYETDYRVRLRIDGLLKQVAKVPVKLQPRIAARLKVMAQLDIAEKRVPQDGRIKLNLSKTKQIDFRVSTLPTLFGEKVVLRILDGGAAKLGIDKLGYEDDQKKLFLEAVQKPYGMVLVTGPTGSGKTVSLYTALNILNDETPQHLHRRGPGRNPRARHQPGADEHQARHDLRRRAARFLRQDPDVIMVGEIRDLETAEIAHQGRADRPHGAVDPAHQRRAADHRAPDEHGRGAVQHHLVGDPGDRPAPGAPPARLQAAKCTCPSTRCWPKASPPTRSHAGIKLYEAVGCPDCTEGYKGRTGIYQVMPMTDEIQDDRAGRRQRACRSPRPRSGPASRDLRQSALLKVRNGVTSLAEINRVTKD